MADQTKAIAAITDEIKVREAELAQVRSDVSRAIEAITEADAFQAKIDDVSRKRAEAKAMAFVDGRKADTTEFDRQEKELERLSKQALEDSAAATIAIELLEKKTASIRQAIDELCEERKQLAVGWLQHLRDAAIDRYVKALISLGPYIADACAADRAIARLVTKARATPGIWLYTEVKNVDLPVPGAWRVSPPGRAPGLPPVTPVEWKRIHNYGSDEYEKLIAQLGTLGILPEFDSSDRA